VNCIPVPEEVKAARPDAVSKVVLPPDGDMLNDKCRSAEMLIGPSDEPGLAIYYGYFKFDKEELDRIKSLDVDDIVIEFAMWGNHVHPFSAAAWMRQGGIDGSSNEDPSGLGS